MGHSAKIERSDLSGNSRMVLVSSAQGLVAPTTLSVDLVAQKLYWLDADAERVGRVNFDGSELYAEHISGLGQVAAMAVYLVRTHRVRNIDVERQGLPARCDGVSSTSTPSYLRLLIQDREHGRNLRSTTTTLCQPFTTTTLAKRAFRCSAPAVWNSLPQTAGLRHSFSLRLSFLSLLTNTLPGPSASEVTTLLRYTNLFIIIIIMSGSPPCTVCSVASLHVYDACRRIDFSVHSATTCRTTAEN